MREILRSSFTADGQRLFLEFDGEHYRVGTRWTWLIKFPCVWDACDAFEVIELMQGDLSQVAKQLKVEIVRVPRWQLGAKRNSPSRIWNLLSCVEKRLSGLRPVSCGSKSSLIAWKPAT